MKRLIVTSFLFATILFSSCNRESDDIRFIKRMTINGESHAFINDDGKHYYESTFTSQQEIHLYKLEMIKGVEYRISASQPEALINQSMLTLTNKSGDILAESLNEGISKSFIVIKSPETTNYYLRVNLMQRTNPKFTYRLYFEELFDNILSISGLDWQCDGTWNLINPNKIELTNYDSRIIRHLKCSNPITGNPDLSYVIRTNSYRVPNFGFIMDASEDLLQFSEYAYELTSTGSAFLTSNINDGYAILSLNTGSIYYDWGSLMNGYLNFSIGIKVEVKYDGSQYAVYLNGTFLKYINGSPNNFTILVEDCGDEITTIEDIQLVY